MDAATIARLRAEALAAEAEAKRAEAAAKQAALEAALAAAGGPAQVDDASPAAPSTQPLPAQAAQVDDAAAAPLSEPVAAPFPPAPTSVPAPTSEPVPASEPVAIAESPAPAQPAPAQPTPTAVPAAAPQPLSDYAAKVQAGYPQDNVLPIGAFLEEGAPVASVPIGLPLAMLNRHGLIAGATGTGKTRTLQLLAEGLSSAGVSVFLTDIKGDLTGLSSPGQPSEKLLARTAALGQDWQPRAFPVELFSLGGEGVGTPIRARVTDFGPLLLAKVLGLNDTQESSLSLIFHWADAQGLELDDLKDLRAVISFLTGPDGKEELRQIGGISAATAGVILRELAALQAQGADVFFGEPAFDAADLLRTALDGRGVISALELPKVTERPALFTTFVMWLLAELFSTLPEVGDQPKPRLVFFFDEAHLLFNGASKEFLSQVIQTVRLIRSKGVGIFFVTQTPSDVPAEVLAQLGARVQHALRAFTPADAKKLKETVSTFPTSPLDLATLLPSLGTGEAVVTVLSERGSPTPVAPTRLFAPAAVMGPATDQVVASTLAASTLAVKYAKTVDDVSAYEQMERRTEELAQEREAAALAQAEEKEAAKAQRATAAAPARRTARPSQLEQAGGGAMKSFLRSVGTQLGREVTRSLFGTRRR